MGMLDKLIEWYHTYYTKKQILIMETIVNTNYFRDECIFFDNGRVASGLKQMEKDFNIISSELNHIKETLPEGTERDKKTQELVLKQYEMTKVACFQGSQNIKNIDNCITWALNIKYDFIDCLYGLKSFAQNDKAAAFDKLNNYLVKHKAFGDHFLLNRVYGELLIERGNIMESMKYMQNAVMLCPDDLYSHEKLLHIYQLLNDIEAITTEERIIEVLRYNEC